jgi:serine/threonine protein kinase
VNQRQRAAQVVSLPERLGRYQVLGHLATGGMAEILLARLEGPGGFQKVVVLKRVLPHLTRKEEFRSMFLDEARIVAGLRHPNVVQVTELGRDKDELFLVMEYLEGESLARLVKRAGPTGLDYALGAHVIAAACAGLHAAHECAIDGVPQQLVHRDVSPQNIFVTYDGNVKVIDFGVAKAATRYTNTSTGQVKGKFSYMAPEQCLAEDVDRRCDVFALGIVLWEATTGQRLYARDNELLVFKAICEDPVPAPSSFIADYPPALERIVMRALRRRREDRYASAAEMRRELVVAVRELAAASIPEDDLGALMKQLFADRMKAKADLLQKVSSGENVGSIDWLEIDTNTGNAGGTVDMAAQTASGMRQSAQTAPPMLPEPAETAAPRRGSRAKLWIALAALLVIGSGSFAAAMMFDWSGSEATVAGAVPATAVPAGEAPPAAASEPAAEAAPSEPAIEAPAAPSEPVEAPLVNVTISLDSTPPGARVVWGGEDRGTTPLALSVPQSTEPIEVTLELEGYEPYAERITPDVNQRLRLSLVRGRARGRARTAQPTPTAQPVPQPAPQQRPGGFYRFD